MRRNLIVSTYLLSIEIACFLSFGGTGICGELRRLELPSQQQNETYRMQEQSPRATSQQIDVSVYEDFERKVKNLTAGEKNAAVRAFADKREQAIKNKAREEVEYYSRLLDILKKCQEGAK